MNKKIFVIGLIVLISFALVTNAARIVMNNAKEAPQAQVSDMLQVTLEQQGSSQRLVNGQSYTLKPGEFSLLVSNLNPENNVSNRILGSEVRTGGEKPDKDKVFFGMQNKLSTSVSGTTTYVVVQPSQGKNLYSPSGSSGDSVFASGIDLNTVKGTGGLGNLYLSKEKDEYFDINGMASCKPSNIISAGQKFACRFNVKEVDGKDLTRLDKDLVFTLYFFRDFDLDNKLDENELLTAQVTLQAVPDLRTQCGTGINDAEKLNHCLAVLDKRFVDRIFK